MGLIATKHAFRRILMKLEDLIRTIGGGLIVLLFAPIIISIEIALDTFKIVIDILCIPWDIGNSLYHDLTGQTKELYEENPRVKEALTSKRHKYVY